MTTDDKPTLAPFRWYQAGMLLVAADVVVLTALYNLFHQLRLGSWIDHFSLPYIGVVLIVVTALYVMDVYRGDAITDRGSLPVRAVFGVLLAGLVSTAFVYLLGPRHFGEVFGRGIMPVTLLAFAGWAAVSRFFVDRWCERKQSAMRWLYIGDRDRFARLREDIRITPDAIDLLLEGAGEPLDPEFQSSVIGSVDDLATLALRDWNGVIIATDHAFSHEEISRLMDMRQNGSTVQDLVAFYEANQTKVPVLHLRHGWFLQGGGFSLLHNRAGIRFKRIIDVLLSAVLVVLTSPLMLLAALAIKLDSPGSVFYSQERVGLNGAAFRLHKFRTMVADAEKAGARWAEQDDPRITRTGRFLRKSRIDELPQLWNVLKGEMSFIGPRPERPEFIEQLEQEIPYYELRHLVKPGITGWAQVMYPYGASVSDALEKLQYDLYYIKNFSLLLDFVILMKTARIVLYRKGR